MIHKRLYHHSTIVLTILRNFILVAIFFSFGQTLAQTLEGQVLSGDGKPVPMVSILIMGNPIGTLSDKTGSFTFKVPKAGNFTFYFFLKGYKPLEQKLMVNQDSVYFVKAHLIRENENSQKTGNLEVSSIIYKKE